MTSFLYNTPAGVAGHITRTQETVVESGFLNPSAAPTAFGAPLKLVSGKFEKIASGDAATVFAGVLSRSVPSVSGDTLSTFGAGTPNVNSVQGVVVKGYVNVVCSQGTPVRGAAVYVRVTADTGKAVGDFETAADSGKCVAIVGATWAVSGKDSNNVSEIRIF
jgi:hypothetical protein